MRLFSLLLLLALATASAQLETFRSIGTDTDSANIPLEHIFSGGPPPQGIPALGFSGHTTVSPSPDPQFVTLEEASAWLEPNEPVIVFNINGEAKAYPLQILTWHEIVNDTVGGVPVIVTFCPLCNSALAFDRRVPVEARGNTPLDEAFTAAFTDQYGFAPPTEAIEVTFGVSGLLYNSNMLMFDSLSGTLWSQLLGEGNVGSLTGTKLLRYPAPIVAFAEFSAAYPEALVLSRETGYSRRYGYNPYLGYDEVDSPPFLFNGVSDGRLPPKTRVVSLELHADVAAYPFESLQEARVIEDTVGGERIVIFWTEGTSSALDAASIAAGQDVGAVNVFRRDLNGQTLSFTWDGESFVDTETRSRWNLLGQAVTGELEGAQLSPVVHDNTLWFAWAAFKPETRIYEGR